MNPSKRTLKVHDAFATFCPPRRRVNRTPTNSIQEPFPFASFPPFHRARPGDTRTIHSDSRLNAPCEIPSVRSSLLTARASVRPPGVSRRANRSDPIVTRSFVRSIRSDRSFVRSRRRRGYVPSSSSGGMEGGVDVAPGSEGGAAGPNCVDARHLHLGPLHLKVIYRYVYVLYDTVGSSDIWMPARARAFGRMGGFVRHARDDATISCRLGRFRLFLFVPSSGVTTGWSVATRCLVRSVSLGCVFGSSGGCGASGF